MEVPFLFLPISSSSFHVLSAAAALYADDRADKVS